MSDPLTEAIAIGVGGLAIGLVGSWLLGPQSGATKPKPEKIPNINMAQRGSPMFITFGTNRVSAQANWQKNFKAKKNSSGGKKGGGSGGMGAAKGASGSQAPYTYSIDMMFHFGMVDLPSNIIRGWVGADPWDADTLTAIQAGAASPSLSTPSGGKKSSGSSGNNNTTHILSHLAFSDCFVWQGWPTGDVNLEAWPYFTAQEVVPIAFPYTVGIGFEHLILGDTPAVPQISIELGASIGGNAAINLSAGYNGDNQLFYNNIVGPVVMVNSDQSRAIYVASNNISGDVFLQVGSGAEVSSLFAPLPPGAVQEPNHYGIEVGKNIIFSNSFGNINLSGLASIFIRPGTSLVPILLGATISIEDGGIRIMDVSSGPWIINSMVSGPSPVIVSSLASHSVTIPARIARDNDVSYVNTNVEIVGPLTITDGDLNIDITVNSDFGGGGPGPTIDLSNITMVNGSINISNVADDAAINISNYSIVGSGSINLDASLT